MVDFIVFNELSLPFKNNIAIDEKFSSFLLLVEHIRSKGLKRIRTTENFKNYQILDEVYLQQFFGQIKDEVLKKKILSFMNSGFVILEFPLIKDEELENTMEVIENSYYYNHIEVTFGGLACASIWDTIAISFNSSHEWNFDCITLKKNEIDINIRHSLNVEHLESHQDFFDNLEEERRLNITQENFWDKREEFFPNKVVFCQEVEKQIKSLNNSTFQYAINMLRDIETDKRPLTKLTISNEGDTVTNSSFLRKKREFMLFGKKEFFEKHIKNFPNNKHRIHFIEREDKIFIGYIGKHLPTKKH